MTDEASTAAASADAHPSQVIEHRESDANAQGRGAELPQGEAPKEEAKPISTRDAIAKAFDEAEARSKADADKAEQSEKPKDEKAEAKAEVKSEEKPDDKQAKPRAEDGKFSKTEKPVEGEQEKDKSVAEKPATGQGGDDARQSEGRKHAEPPARFLPEARTKWANVPNEVKAEVHRVAQEYETELSKAKEVTERYEPIRQFDDIARQNGRELKDSLTKMVQVEQALARSPVVGLEMILREIGPRKADGSPLSLYDVAQMVARQTPQQFQQNMSGALGQTRQSAQNTQQQPPQIAALEQKIAALEGRLASSSVQPIIEQFKAERPDYQQLEPQIAEILKSKVIENLYGTGLSPEQKLEQAYRMAGGQGPASQSAAPAPAAHSQAETPARPEIDPDGQKSIKGAPSSGQTGEPKRKFKSNRAALEAAFDAVR